MLLLIAKIICGDLGLTKGRKKIINRSHLFFYKEERDMCIAGEIEIIINSVGPALVGTNDKTVGDLVSSLSDSGALGSVVSKIFLGNQDVTSQPKTPVPKDGRLKIISIAFL